MTAPRHAQVEELLGAFALDALEPEEATVVDDHLRECPRCRAEVAEYREAAAMLAFGGVEAPPGLWEKIQASLEEAPPKLELARVVPIERSRWRSMGARLTAAAAIVISVVALGVAVLKADAPVHDGSIDAEIAAAAVDPDAVLVNLVSTTGAGSAKIVLLDGRAYLADHTLPPLPADETYQVWGQRGDTFISLGVLGERPQRGQLAAAGDFEAMAITAEKKPGVVQTKQPAVVAGWVPTD